VGDGNPGAVNAWRAAGGRAGVPAGLFDFLKAAVPVGLANWVFGVSGWGLLPIALAPIVGHAGQKQEPFPLRLPWFCESYQI
jgi:glycerol-3-phosphate acyltransferase PlsY